MKKSIWVISILFLFFTTFLSAQNKDEYTMKKQLELEIPSNPIISPSGDKVIFSIRKSDFKKSKWIRQVYILDIDSLEYHQFTNSNESAYSAKFSPDGNWVTFISSRDTDTDQIWAMRSDGGEAVKWTDMPKDVEEYTWSHNSKIIAFLSTKFDKEKEDKKEYDIKHKIDGKEFPFKNPVKILSYFDVSKKIVTNSFPLDPGVQEIKFNKNDSLIIYQTNYTNEYDDEQKYDIFTIDLNGNKKQITSAKGPETQPAYSPDNKNLAYITQTVPDIEFAQTDIIISGIDSNYVKNLTVDLDLSINNFIWKDDENILFTVSEGTNTQIYQVNIDSAKIDKLTNGNNVISNLSYTSNRKKLCYLNQSDSSLSEIFVNGKKLTNFSEQLENYNFGSQKVITYKSTDGKYDIDGILFTPQNFDSLNKYPLILTVHGGPYGAFKNKFYQTYGIREFTQNGYVVFAPNPRGSNGYSDVFGRSARYDLGGGDYRDVMAGVDYVISQGFIDTTKMGVTGGSYGGYLTNWIISQNKRFSAAVSMYGIFSWFTDWSNSWQPSFEKMYFGYYYWERPIDMDNLYVSRSPAFYTQNIVTPTLILHGAADVYTDVSNSREMYQALKAKGVPVEFVIYPRAGHGIRNEPNQYIDIVSRSVKWFNKLLK